MNSTFIMQKIVKYNQYSPHFRIRNALFLISLSGTSIFRDALEAAAFNRVKVSLLQRALLNFLVAPLRGLNRIAEQQPKSASSAVSLESQGIYGT